MKEDLAIQEVSKIAMYALILVVLSLILFYGLAASKKSISDSVSDLYPDNSTTKANTFVWSDVYDLNGVHSYKYEITRISGEDLTTQYASFMVDVLPDNYKVRVVVYDGAVPAEGEFYEYLDNINYYCSSKEANGRKLTCEHTFPDARVEYASHVLPDILKKDAPMIVLPRESAVYKGKVYDALLLVSLDGNVKAWMVQDIPVPVRLEVKNGEDLYIAKLINFV